MSEAALLAVAHGSADPRAEPVLDALIARVRSERPGVVAALSHLGFSEPDVPTALDSLVREGFREIVVVPLLLSAAYHATVDLPGSAGERRTRSSWRHDPAGRSARPAPAAVQPPPASPCRREGRARSGSRPRRGRYLRRAVNAELADVAASFGATIGFASGTPAIADVVAGLRAGGAGQVAVATYVIAPGQFVDRLYDAGADVVTDVLGAAPELVELVLHRYDAAVFGSRRAWRRHARRGSPRSRSYPFSANICSVVLASAGHIFGGGNRAP